MAGYTKEFLLEVYMSRFLECKNISIEQLCTMEENASDLYDKVGKDKFRDYASLDAAAIAAFKKRA